MLIQELTGQELGKQVAAPGRQGVRQGLLFVVRTGGWQWRLWGAFLLMAASYFGAFTAVQTLPVMVAALKRSTTKWLKLACAVR